MTQEFKDDVSSELWRLSKKSWTQTNVLGDHGSYSGVRYLSPFSSDYENLAVGMTSEGVGTKTEFAEETGLWDGIGSDLAAMVLDDVSRLGAQALGMTSTLNLGAHAGDSATKTRLLNFMLGFVTAARSVGVPVLDGEFSEMGGRINGNKLPLIVDATATWTIDRNHIVDGKKVRPGDAIIALGETGFRSNGFTFLRSVLDKVWGDDWKRKLIQTSEGGRHVVEYVMEPSTVYYGGIQTLLSRPDVRDAITGMVHVTGGGVPGKLGRYLTRSQTSATIHSPMSCVSPLITYFLDEGHVTMRQAIETWNMGYGFLIITSHPQLILDCLADRFHATKVGSVTEPKDRIVSMNVSAVLDF